MISVITSVISIVVTSFCGYVVWLLQKRSDQNDAQKNGIKLILKSVLKSYHKEYTERGYLSSNDFTEYEEMYNAYHNLGGNGTATKWFEEIKGLNIKDDDC